MTPRHFPQAAAWLSAAILCAGFNANASDVFAKELGPDAAAVAADVKVSMMNGDGEGADNGRGPVPYLKALGKPPARVALVSFYVWDCGNKKESSYRIYGGNYTYHVTNTRKRAVAEGEVAVLANELHDAGIAALKESFSAVGMQLLTADEFLDTPDKRAAYDAFKMEAGGFSGLLRGLQEKSHGDVWQWGAPDGYRVLELTTRGDVKGNQFQLGQTGISIGKTAAALGYDLAAKLGVDAVVILYNVVQADKTTINMRGAGLYMFGPNPVPNSGQSLYWNGHQYSGVYLRMKDVPFIKTDKNGSLVDADYRGYAIVAGALGKRMAEHVKGKTG